MKKCLNINTSFSDIDNYTIGILQCLVGTKKFVGQRLKSSFVYICFLKNIM